MMQYLTYMSVMVPCFQSTCINLFLKVAQVYGYYLYHYLLGCLISLCFSFLKYNIDLIIPTLMNGYKD